MPELPDLQVFSGNLNKRLAGVTLDKVNIINKKKLKSSSAKIKKAVEGQQILKISRVGKELHFVFNNGNVLALHLMLRGGLHYFEKINDKKYTILEMHFNDGTGLAMADPQGAATPTLNPAEKKAPDALSRLANKEYLKDKLSSSRATIKNLLLDQNIIRGIGNAYADEILWKSRISPFSISSRIPKEKVDVLSRTIPAVLKNAVKEINKTEPEKINGEIRDFLDIHNPKKKKSPDGAKIINKKTGGRKTYYTKEQKEYK